MFEQGNNRFRAVLLDPPAQRKHDQDCETSTSIKLTLRTYCVPGTAGKKGKARPRGRHQTRSCLGITAFLCILNRTMRQPHYSGGIQRDSIAPTILPPGWDFGLQSRCPHCHMPLDCGDLPPPGADIGDASNRACCSLMTKENLWVYPTQEMNCSIPQPCSVPGSRSHPRLSLLCCRFLSGSSGCSGCGNSRPAFLHHQLTVQTLLPSISASLTFPGV